MIEQWFAAQQFLLHEADLMDRRCYTEWLELFTDDAVYWVPGAHDGDPTRDVSIIYDDRRRLGERVGRLSGKFAFAQQPESRTCHLVGNVRVQQGADGVLDVRSNLVLVEVRRGQQTVLSGAVEHQLVPHDDSFRIRRKVLRLLESELPLGNLTFLM